MNYPHADEESEVEPDAFTTQLLDAMAERDALIATLHATIKGLASTIAAQNEALAASCVPGATAIATNITSRPGAFTAAALACGLQRIGLVTP